MNEPNVFIHRFDPGTSGRTLLLLHGTGGNEDDLLPLGRALDPRAARLSPRGRVLEKGMPRFFRRLAEGVFDEEDLIRRTHELADFILWSQAEYQLDAKRLVAVGYSNGANIAASLLLLRPGILRAAALFRPMLPLEPPSVPALAEVPIFISLGTADRMIPAASSRALVALLERAGASVTMHEENAGHEITEEAVERATLWLSAL